MRKCYMLIGIPYSGKTTFAEKYFKNKSFMTISTDEYIAIKANLLGRDFSDIFKDTIDEATEFMYKQLHYALSNNLDIVWDQTNLTSETRKQKLSLLPDTYTKIGCVFETPDYEEFFNRRTLRKEKVIPLEVIENMKKTFEVPSLEEGFDEIYKVKFSYSLEKFV